MAETFKPVASAQSGNLLMEVNQDGSYLVLSEPDSNHIVLVTVVEARALRDFLNLVLP